MFKMKLVASELKVSCPYTMPQYMFIGISGDKSLFHYYYVVN